jgi:hypothetical protein
VPGTRSGSSSSSYGSSSQQSQPAAAPREELCPVVPGCLKSLKFRLELELPRALSTLVAATTLLLVRRNDVRRVAVMMVA